MCSKIGFIIIVISLFSNQLSASKECAKRDYDHGTVVCVCNSTYCDTVDPVKPVSPKKYIIYSSNKDGLRFHKEEGLFEDTEQKDSEVVIRLNSDIRYQQIIGWGGALTDAAGYNIQKLPKAARENLLRSYYSKEGIEYSLTRIPIGCSDFSLNYYSYDENPGDVNLTKFNLTDEDYNYKIPFMKKALSLSNNTLKFFASSWTPPVWMKTNNKPAGMGFLKHEYYQTWADYHIKFLDAYKKEGLQFWGVTTGNEPILGITPLFDITSLGWLPWDQGIWIEKNLGPAIKNNPEYSNINIIAHDDERLSLPFWMLLSTFNNNSTKYIDGIGVHWYTDPLFPFLLSLTRFLFPTKFLLGTEACAGDRRYKQKVVLGNWRRGEQYVEDIMEDLDYWFTGWVDWNIALNLKGGPTYINNFVDSCIIVNATAKEFYKQPTYYTMGHFSKFVPPESYKIWTQVSSKNIKTMGFVRPDTGIALIIYNRHQHSQLVSIYDDSKGYINLNISARSVNTMMYW